MGRQRYTPEFKDEAVRQVTERGHPTTEVTARLGVSIHSLHQSVRDVGPSKDEKRPGELLKSKKEILRLQAELRRARGRARYPEKSRGRFNQSKIRLRPRGA